MGGEELELLCAAAAGARYSEPIKKEGLNQGEGLNQTDPWEKFTSVITYSTGFLYRVHYRVGLCVGITQIVSRDLQYSRTTLLKRLS